MERTIRLLVVDDSPDLADRLARSVTHAGVRIGGPVLDAIAAERELEREGADVVVVSIGRTDGRGQSIVASLCRQRATPVLVASASPMLGLAHALAAGALGILECDDATTVVDALRRAMSGELVLPERELPSLVEAIRQPVEPGLDRLTDREHEILRLFAEGVSTSEVAARLGISVGTVQSHAKNVLAKLGVHSKVEAVRILLRDGMALARRSS